MKNLVRGFCLGVLANHLYVRVGRLVGTNAIGAAGLRAEATKKFLAEMDQDRLIRLHDSASAELERRAVKVQSS